MAENNQTVTTELNKVAYAIPNNQIYVTRVYCITNFLANTTVDPAPLPQKIKIKNKTFNKGLKSIENIKLHQIRTSAFGKTIYSSQTCTFPQI